MATAAVIYLPNVKASDVRPVFKSLQNKKLPKAHKQIPIRKTNPAWMKY